MSQPNYPPAFTINSFVDTDSNGVPFQPWVQPGSRSMGSLPSPSASVRTAMTAPNLRTANHTNMGASTKDQQESRIDPSLSQFNLLTVPSFSRPRSAMDNANQMNYISQVIYNEADEPWSSEKTRNFSVNVARPAFPQSNMTFGSYREQPGSENDQSDSGYYTHHPQSVINSEPGRINQDLPTEVYQVADMNVNSAPSEATEMFPMHSDQASQYSGRSTPQSKGTRKCPQCSEILKCPSDYKKHMLKHDKPHTCDHPGCKRAATGRGFTTINDLQRHKKSVHRLGVEKDSYQCASENCRNRGKIWPRLDNFKQHINRMHKGEDEIELIKRSAYHEPYIPNLSVAPMDTTLAGIGTERQFHGNEIDDPASGISLTPDQDSSHWTYFDPSSHGFAMDVDRSNSKGQQQSTFEDENSVKPTGPQRASISKSSSETKTRQGSLQILADVASTQVSPDHTGPSSCRPLSIAPQTKAEQQREALKKLSKVIVGEIQSATSPDAVDLEHVLMRVLYGRTNQARQGVSMDRSSSSSSNEHVIRNSPDFNDAGMTKSEALKASQAISNLIKQSGGLPAAPRPRRVSKTSASNSIKCKHCDALLPRSCDLKKHMKRHTKPYGCTYPKCHKRFGAKSDWKRHEHSQHFQLESFRCCLPLPSSSKAISEAPQLYCTSFFQRPELFREHLTKDHQMPSELLEKEVRDRRIGRNGQSQFWCGFCYEGEQAGKIVKLKEKRNAAWDERFDHIDKHFSKDKLSIDDWICVEAGRKKGDVKRDFDRTKFEDDGEGGGGEPDDTEDTNSSGHDDPKPAPAPVPRLSSSAQSPAPSVRKRQMQFDNPESMPATKHRKREVSRYCCSCECGPWLLSLYGNCMNCNHDWCSNCPVVPNVVMLEGNAYQG